MHMTRISEFFYCYFFKDFLNTVMRCRGGRCNTRHEVDASPRVYVRVGAAVPTPAHVAALAVPLREYSEFSVRCFALQRLLLVCPVLARKSIPAMPTQGMIAMGTISSHSYPPEPL